MKGDGPILAFDTATTRCSVGVTCGPWGDGLLLGTVEFDTGVTHSRQLPGAIDWLLSRLQMDIDELAGIAVGLGPGSFTGLRIGMATAKGLCHAARLPLLGISSLDATAAPVRSEKLICVAMDARKKEVYSCFYRSRPGEPARRCAAPAVMAPEALAAMIDEPVVMAGDAVIGYDELFSAMLGDSYEPLPVWHRYPRAEQIGLLAAAGFERGAVLDLDAATPDYLRSSDVELSLGRST